MATQKSYKLNLLKSRFAKWTTRVFGVGLIVFVFYWWLCLPTELFNTSFSKILLDRNGELLGARVAQDDQWRFPKSDSIPEKYERALLCFEDKRFYNHPGVDFSALVRATKSNLRAGRIVSGGSTITMQLMRMSRRKKDRGLFQKFIEMCWATRAEIRFSKREILNQYAAHAPFGGNVVGLEAAAWRYFGKSPYLISWGEAATLAVLPNSPSLIHPGRNRELLLAKRNRLLDRMVASEILSARDGELAKMETLPPKPFPMPQVAPHYLHYWNKRNGKGHSPIDKNIQLKTTEIVRYRHEILSENNIQNMAAMIIDISTNKVIAYVGNTRHSENKHENAIDMIQAERSSGSILKPMLYAAALQEGLIYPSMLLPDLPTSIQGYRPENFNRDYDGLVAADEALSRSLNIPAVHLLQQYGVPKFLGRLKEAGLNTFHFDADHYGLPLIIGGGEITLWEITNAYGQMAKRLDRAYVNDHDPEEVLPWHYGALWSMSEAMKDVRRPTENGQWETFSDAQNISWKTGTSYGFKDAWAVGFNKKYAIGVWVGNATGEGRPSLIGSKAAAPVLFDLFRSLPSSNDFEPPYDGLKEAVICQESGHPVNQNCPHGVAQWIPKVNYKVGVCPYHQSVKLDQSTHLRVNQIYHPSNQIVDTTFFVLNPAEAYYYSRSHAHYQPIPEFMESASTRQNFHSTAAPQNLQFIYPTPGAKIFIPTDHDGKPESVICKIASNHTNEALYWYLDDKYLGQTEDFHTQMIDPKKGNHRLVVTTSDGNRQEVSFEILTK